PKKFGSDIEAGLAALSKFDELDFDLDNAASLAPLATSQPATLAPKPEKKKIRLPSFTELELEGDSLLHAVETAAAAGIAQRDEEPEEELLDTPDELHEKLEPGALPKIPLFSDLAPDAFIELFERCPLKRLGVGDR